MFTCEDKYTTQIDEILTLMQKDGYKIINVQVNTVQNRGTGIWASDMEGYATLITYK